MSHYFSRSDDELAKSKPQLISYSFGKNTYRFVTDTSVFSYGKMDVATDILIQNIPPLKGTLLDLGCGYGALGIVVAKEYGLTLTQADINPRALQLAIENADQNGVASTVVDSDAFSRIDDVFNTIAMNPPIHAGKNLIFSMYESAWKHLHQDSGALYVVIQKKHGAESSINRIKEIFGNCQSIYKKKGLYVLQAYK